MEQNKFEIIGRINHIEINDYKNCKVAKMAVSKRIREDEYVSYWVTMFNDDAVHVYSTLKKGDSAYFTGKLSISKFVVDEKTIEKVDLIATDFKKVKYDTDKKQYVEITAEGVEDWD